MMPVERRILIKAASMYYLDHMKQSEIARRMGVDRTTVSKYLKKAMNNGISLPMEKAVEVEEKLFGDCFETHDQVEGMQCFLSREKPKPKPVFTNN